MNYEKTQIKTLAIDDFHQKIFWVLVSTIVVCVVLYMAIVARTIINVVDRKVAEENIKHINSSISELQSEYIALGQEIDLSYAKTNGFHEVANIDYVSRIPTLTMRDNVR